MPTTASQPRGTAIPEMLCVPWGERLGESSFFSGSQAGECGVAGESTLDGEAAGIG